MSIVTAEDYEAIEGLLGSDCPDLRWRVDEIADFYLRATAHSTPEQKERDKGQREKHDKIIHAALNLINAIDDAELGDDKPTAFIRTVIEVAYRHEESARGGLKGRPRRSPFENALIHSTAKLYEDVSGKEPTTNRNAPTPFVELLEIMFRIVGKAKAWRTLSDQAAEYFSVHR